MIYLVFHNTDFMKLRDGQVPHTRLAFVAAVQCKSLSDVFSFTNHVDDGWQHGENVLAGMYAPRSTCAGDIIIDENLQMHLIADEGFTRLGHIEESVGFYSEMLTAFLGLFSLGKSGIHLFAVAAHDLVAHTTGAYSDEKDYQPHYRLLPECRKRYEAAYKAIHEGTELKYENA